MNGARTSAKGVTFNYADPEEGRYIYTPDIVDPVARGNTTPSQSGKMNKTMVKPILFFATLGDREVFRGEESIAIRDLDGSISGLSGVTIVNDEATYLSAKDNCQDKPDWNMKICDTKLVHVRNIKWFI